MDSGTTYTIICVKKYFLQSTLAEINVDIVSGIANMIKGSRRACGIFPNMTKLFIDDALYFSRSRRNLLSFKDIHRNKYHVETKKK